MTKVFDHPVMGYSLAILLTAGAVAARYLIDPWLDDRLALVTLFPVIAAAVWLGGYRVALIPAILGYLACDYLFLDHAAGLSLSRVPGRVGFAAYLVSAATIIWFGEEMRRARAQAQDQRELLRVTLASIGDAVITTDIEGRVTSMNATALSMTAWQEDEAVGTSVDIVFDIVNEETREKVPSPISKALGENVIVGLANHTVLLSKDGRETAIDDSAAPIRDLAGRLVGGVLIFRDISERRDSEKALRESEVRHRFLAALAMATQHLIEPDEIMSISARLLAEHLGADRCAYAEVEDESLFVITGDYTRNVPSIIGRWPVAAFGAEVERLMLENVPYVIDDVDIDPRAGSDLEAYRQTMIQAVICVPLHKAGKFTAAMAVHQKTPRHWSKDEIELVTTVVGRCWEALERSQADRKLKITADRLVLALDASSLGDWSWDAFSDIVTLSDRAAEIFGIPPGPSMTWTRMQELLHDDDRERARSEVEQAVAAHEQYDIEYRVIQPSGGEIWVSAKGRAQYETNGLPLGMFGVVQDVTERKRLESNLRQHATELADADRKKDDFIALLAHELRNPLAPIRTGLDVIRLGSADSERVAQARAMMERQLSHMVRLVDDLLDVSRITRNKLLLQTRPISLSEVMDHAIESSKPMLQSAGHQLVSSIPDETITINGDLTRLTQVFGNLIANSAKFTDAGGTIEIVALAEKGRVTILVKDNGIGIPSEDLPSVFEMFVQVDRTGGGARGGLGIGLGLVKALVEMHGGTVEAKSDGRGKGSTFSVSLPIAERTTTFQPENPGGGFPQSVLSTLRVLVADDNRDGADSLAHLLAILGSDVHTAFNGIDAITSADRIRPDLILMDVGMPQLGGLEATSRIRALPWGKKPAIIALTGWGREEDREKSRVAGCDGHLVKPVSLEELESLLIKLQDAGKVPRR